MGTDYIVVALSVLQGVSTLIFILTLAVYAERETSIERLSQASRHFLTNELTSAFKSKVWLVEGKGALFPVVELRNKTQELRLPEELVGWYLIKIDKYMLFVDIWFNFRNLVLIYYFPTENQRVDDNGVPVGLKSTLSGFASAYYTVRAERELLEYTNLEALAVYLYANLSEDIITNPNARLFWINDICNMTRSIFRQAQLGRLQLWPPHTAVADGGLS